MKLMNEAELLAKAKGIGITASERNMTWCLGQALNCEAFDLAEFFITKGANVNAVLLQYVDAGLMAINHMPGLQANLKIIEFLIKHGADFNIKSDAKRSALDIALLNFVYYERILQIFGIMD